MNQTNSQNTAPKDRATPGKRRALWIVLAIVLLLAAGGTAAYIMLREEAPQEIEFDTEAMQGRIRVMTPEEQQAEIDRVVEEGMFNISIAANVVFASPEAQGDARIENISANRYHMQVSITLKDTGEEVYASKAIRPDTYIQYITLNRPLDPGVYHAVATFTAITQDTHEVFGTTAAEILLTVLEPPAA